VFAVLGVTGAIAALGDTLFPVQSLAQGFEQDLNPAANLFVRLRWLHPLGAALCGAWLFFYLHVTAREEGMWRPAALAALLLVAQIACGILNLLLLAPIWMQMLHLLMADAAWIALVLVAGAKMARKTV
jgi:heme A synthase